jgi:hypothetical protein
VHAWVLAGDMYQPSDRLTTALGENLARAGLEVSKTSHLGGVMYHLAKLGWTPPSASLAVLERALEHHATELGAADVGRVMWAYAAPCFPPPSGAVRDILEARMVKLAGTISSPSSSRGLLTEQDLATILWAYGALSRRGALLRAPCPQVVRAFAVAGTRCIPTMNPQALSMLLLGWGQVTSSYPDAAPPPELLRLAQDRFHALLSEAAFADIHRGGPIGVATAISGFTHLGHDLDPSVNAQVEQAITGYLRSAFVSNIKIVQDTIWAWGRMRYTPSAVTAAFLADTLRPHIPTFDAQYIGLVPWSFARMDRHPGREFLEDLAFHLESELQRGVTFRERESLAQIFTSWSAFGFRPRVGLLELMFQNMYLPALREMSLSQVRPCTYFIPRSGYRIQETYG